MCLELRDGILLLSLLRSLSNNPELADLKNDSFNFKDFRNLSFMWVVLPVQKDENGKVTHEQWGATEPGVECFCCSPPFPGEIPTQVPLLNLREETDNLKWHFLSKEGTMRWEGQNSNLGIWSQIRCKETDYTEAFVSKGLYNDLSSWVHATNSCRPVSRKIREVRITRNCLTLLLLFFPFLPVLLWTS